MKTVYLIYLFCGLHFSLAAQMLSNVEAIESGGSLTQYNMIGKERPAPEVKGDYYLFEDWVVADLSLAIDKTIKGQQLNLNLQDGDIEIPYGENVRILNREKIKLFTVDNRNFINARYIEGVNNKDAFLEIMEKGKIKVYCQYYSDVRPPTYVPGLAVGDRNYKILIKETYYIQWGASFEIFSNDKKRNIKYFEGDQLTSEFIRKEKLRMNKIADFLEATRFYNNRHPD